MKFRKFIELEKKGQFIIIASLLIGVLVLGLAIGVNEMGLQRQQLRYKPLKELIFAITSDAHRALTYALRKGTEKYNESFLGGGYEGYENDAYEKIDEFMSKWTRSVLTSYASEGIQLKIPFGDPLLFQKEINWRSNIGFSSVVMRHFSLNLTAEGFSGWMGELANIFVLFLPIYGSEEENVQTLNFACLKWRGEMGETFQTHIHDLLEKDVKIWQFIQHHWEPVNIERLEYLGLGNYKVYLTDGLPYGTSIKMVVVVPEDEVLVGATTLIQKKPEWETLYFQSPYYLSPEYLLLSPSHLIQPFSRGQGKEEVKLQTKQTTPSKILLEDFVTINMSLRRNPPKAGIESVEVIFGYTYGQSVEICRHTYSSGAYGGTEALISAFKNGMLLNIPDANREIPKDSTVWLQITVMLQKPYGTTMVECGVRFDSQIQLKFPPIISNLFYSLVNRTLTVKADVSDIETGGSDISYARIKLSNADIPWDSGWKDMELSPKSSWKDVQVSYTIELPEGFVQGKDYSLEIQIEAYDSVRSRGWLEEVIDIYLKE